MVFQKDETHNNKDVFRLPCCKVFKKYLTLLGQSPYESDGIRRIKVIVLLCNVTSLLVLSVSRYDLTELYEWTVQVIQFILSIRANDIDIALECIPCIVTSMGAVMKIMNHYINKRKFENLFNRMSEQWEISKRYGELHVLNEIAEQGSKMGSLYRNSLFAFLVLFLSIPLTPPILDFIAPLNETRMKLPLFKLNYIINMDKYFYTVYLHTAWCSIIDIVIITTLDSLYIVIIHYACGLFVLCGYQLKKATGIGELNAKGTSVKNITRDQFKRCMITHYEAIKFYEYVNESTRTVYLLLVGLNIVIISITAVQIVMNIDRPAEVLRLAMYIMGQQFHLFALSLPGQVLIDRSSALTNDIYFSNWYQIPLKYEKQLHIMQIRSSRPCSLSAGGIYEMNIENFGTTFKTCMSYFTILLSLRE